MNLHKFSFVLACCGVLLGMSGCEDVVDSVAPCRIGEVRCNGDKMESCVGAFWTSVDCTNGCDASTRICKIPEGKICATDTCKNSTTVTKCVDGTSTVDVKCGSGQQCFAGVGNIGSEFDPEWKNVYFELYYFDSYSWIYALDDALDGDPLKAIEAWMDLAVKCRAAVKRSAACYNIALVCYLLEQNELAEKWLEQSDTIAPMDGSLALHQSLAKVKKK